MVKSKEEDSKGKKKRKGLIVPIALSLASVTCLYAGLVVGGVGNLPDPFGLAPETNKQGTAEVETFTTQSGDEVALTSDNLDPNAKNYGGLVQNPDGSLGYDLSELGTYTGYDGIEVFDRGDDNYLDLYYNEAEGQFATYAQTLNHTFTEAESQCSLAPKNEENLTGTATTWSIPALGSQAKVGYSQTNPVYLPSNPVNGQYGTWYSATSHLRDSQGSGLYLGHVNYGPGVLSAVGGDKSPWGQLHRIQPCMRKYITDETGKQYEYVAVSAQQVLASQVEGMQEIWATTGEHVMYDITCAGPLGFGDDGQGNINSLLGDYPYRIIIKWKPVTT